MTLILLSMFAFLLLFGAIAVVSKLDSYERRKLWLKTLGRKRFLKAQQLREANMWIDDVRAAMQFLHDMAGGDPQLKAFITIESLTIGLENLERAQSILKDAVVREERFIPRLTPKEKEILADIMEWLDD